MQVESGAILMEAPPAVPEELARRIYTRVFHELKPRTPLPAIHVQFRRYANANAQVQLRNGELRIKMADTLAGAPEDVIEALARRRATPPRT